MLKIATLSILALLGSVSAASALSSCEVGQRVKIPGGQLGTVIETPNGACVVETEREISTWAAFMLDAVNEVEEEVIDPIPASGNYHCYGTAGGNLKLRFGFGNTYANEQGKSGRYKVRSDGQLEFVSGPWAGNYAKALRARQVGLTSKPGSTFYNMMCDLL